MDSRVTQWLRGELSTMSLYMMERRFYAAPAEVLYEGLIGNERVHRILNEAASYLPCDRDGRRSDYTWRIPVALNPGYAPAVPFTVRLSGNRKFLQPAVNAMITSNTEFGRAMLEAAETARACALTTALFDDFNQILSEARQIGTMLPWTRDLARNCRARSTDPEVRRRFFSNIGLWRDSMQETFVATLDRLMGAGASSFPSLSPRVNEACKIGSGLLAQYRMLTEAPPVEEPPSFIRPQPAHEWLPEWYRSDMEEIKHEWRQMQSEARDVRLAKKRAR